MCQRIVTLSLLVLVMALPAAAQRPHYGPCRSSANPVHLVFEAAAAVPLNDLADDYALTEDGMGSTTGYEVGGRLRYVLSPTTSIGPAVHYTNFGNWNGVLDDGGQSLAYAVRTSVWRVGLDLQQFLAPARASVRPYVTVGLGLCHNRYEDWLEGDGLFETTSNNLAGSAGGGLAMGPMEISALWTYNPVTNRQLPLDSGKDETDWSYFVVRAGIAFGAD